jgi:hypothetical protein
MSVQAPGSVLFDEDERALVDEANVILVTGWTHEQYMDAPLNVIDAVMQTYHAQKELEVWRWNRGRSKKLGR